MTPVKKRSAGGRRERAQATRRRILASAHTQFVERGYAATTMYDIATDAGVAVQTVYYTFKTKALLLQEVVEFAGAGDPDAPPVSERPWMREALTNPNGDRALAVAIEHGVDIFARAAPLWPALDAAAVTDPDAEAYLRSLSANRRAGMGELVQRLDSLGYLRQGLSPARGTDVVFALFNHETYLALTRDASWSTEEYKAWLWTTLRGQLADETAATADALQGLSFEKSVQQ